MPVASYFFSSILAFKSADGLEVAALTSVSAGMVHPINTLQWRVLKETTGDAHNLTT